MDTQANDAVHYIGYEFRELIKTYNSCMQRTLNKYGLYPGQPSILFALSRTGKLTQNELARELGISKASVGVSLRRMEKAGFIRRAQDKDDTRCNRVVLTRKGMDYIRWCEIDFNMIYTTMLEEFSGEERTNILGELKYMKNSLLKLQSRLNSRYSGGDGLISIRQSNPR